MHILKNTPYTSMVEIRVCEKCMKSNANNPAASSASSGRLNMRLPNAYIRGIIATPNSAPMIRQPKGFMPNIATPTEMIIFPSGGCETS